MAEMLNYDGGTLVKWMHNMCELEQEEGKVPTKRVGKDHHYISHPIRGRAIEMNVGAIVTSLLNKAGKVYEKIVIEQLQKITETRISEKQSELEQVDRAVLFNQNNS